MKTIRVSAQVIQLEYRRKLVHFISACVAGALPYFLSGEAIILGALVYAALAIVTHERGVFKTVRGLKRVSYGEIFFPFAVVLLAYLFLPTNLLVYQFGLLLLAFPDTLATLIGMQWRTPGFEVPGGYKTIGGSLVFFVVTILVSFSFFAGPWSVLVLLALLLTIAEFSLGYGADNLVLPVLGALLVQQFLM